MYPLDDDKVDEQPMWKDPKRAIALNLTHCNKEK
jgi:hypothetical protein